MKARVSSSTSARGHLREGRSRYSALCARMPRMPSCLCENQSVHRHSLDAGTGADAGWHLALFRQWQLFHYMGCSTFSNHTVLPEIAVARSIPTRRSTRSAISAVASPPASRRDQYAKVTPGATAIVFGLGGIGLNVIQGLRLVGADMIIGVDLNEDKKEWGERFGMTHFVNPKDVGDDLVPYLVNMTKRGADQIGGADYTFDCTGNVNVMRQALESAHRGWGESIIIGVAGAGQEISTRPFQLVTGRVWKGTAFGGARGRTDVPKSLTGTWTARSRSTR